MSATTLVNRRRAWTETKWVSIPMLIMSSPLFLLFLLLLVLI